MRKFLNVSATRIASGAIQTDEVDHLNQLVVISVRHHSRLGNAFC